MHTKIIIMETILIKAGQLVLSLSILVILHELGHFIPAKLFKTKVEKFFLFFDIKFALFKKKIGETVYGIGWLPLGGYVKIAGMIDESMDKEQMAQPAQPWEFRSKPAWQRLIIMIGGVVVNLLLGFFIYSMIFSVWGKNITVQKPDGHVVTIAVPDSLGMQIFRNDRSPIPFYKRRTTEIDSVIAGSAAQKAGLLKGDHLVSINGHPIEFFDQVKGHLTEGENTIEVLRAGQTQSVSITPDKGILGVFAAHFYDTGSTHRSYSFSEAISEGVSFGYWTLRDYITQFKYIFTKKGASQVGGLGSMAGLFSPQWDWLHFWEITALLSIILAFMNILPIPALDGGHIVFLLYEMVTGRKPSEKVLEYAQMVGIIIVFALLIYANGNDIYRWLTGGK